MVVVVHIEGTAVGIDIRGKPVIIGVFDSGGTAAAEITGLSDVEEPFALDACTFRPGIKLFVFVAAFKISGFNEPIAG